MGNMFVAVPAETLEAWLQERKFERTVQYREVVYVRKSSRHPHVLMKVYTSVKDGQVQVRNAGKDAIRVCVVFDNGQRSFGIGKFNPILRVTSVESVLTRLKERLVEAAKRADEWIAQDAVRSASYRNAGIAADVQAKNEFSRREARQESQAFLLDPDFQDPCSEPPEALFAGDAS